MSEPFIGEIRMMPYSYAPVGWLLCAGQMLKISDNTTLFSIIGTIYGGDGRTTFALPDLRYKVPIGTGRGVGLTSRRLGDVVGQDRVTLDKSQLPTHSHDLRANVVTNEIATSVDPKDCSLGVIEPSPGGRGKKIPNELYAPNGSEVTLMATDALSKEGNQLPHSNVQPSLVFNFCIAMEGTYPQRP